MTGHTGLIYSLAFSNESSLLVSGGADWTVRCWNVKTEGSSSRSGSLQNSSANKASLNDVFSNDAMDEDGVESYVSIVWFYRRLTVPAVIHRKDLLATFPTKRTPIVDVHMTPRNLCLVSGPYLSPEQR